MRVRRVSRATAALGAGLGVLVSLAVVIPAMSQTPDDTKDRGKQMAIAAGCDLSQKDIAMSVTPFEDWTSEKPITLRQAVLGVADFLAEEGEVFSEAELTAAADKALGSNPYVVQLPGVSIEVRQNEDASYAVTEVVQCA